MYISCASRPWLAIGPQETQSSVRVSACNDARLRESIARRQKRGGVFGHTRYEPPGATKPARRKVATNSLPLQPPSCPTEDKRSYQHQQIKRVHLGVKIRAACINGWMSPPALLCEKMKKHTAESLTTWCDGSVFPCPTSLSEGSFSTI